MATTRELTDTAWHPAPLATTPSTLALRWNRSQCSEATCLCHGTGTTPFACDDCGCRAVFGLGAASPRPDPQVRAFVGMSKQWASLTAELARVHKDLASMQSNMSPAQLDQARAILRRQGERPR